MELQEDEIYAEIQRLRTANQEKAKKQVVRSKKKPSGFQQGSKPRRLAFPLLGFLAFSLMFGIYFLFHQR